MMSRVLALLARSPNDRNDHLDKGHPFGECRDAKDTMQVDAVVRQAECEPWRV
jgi:hypothetical protein